MLRLFRHLKGSYRYIVCIVLLLLLQANCDLALPSYTSNIVNVGIQQKGIEDGVPEEMVRNHGTSSDFYGGRRWRSGKKQL